MSKRFGLARVLSKMGYCSRSEAFALIRAGKVQVDGRMVRNPEAAVDAEGAEIRVEGKVVGPSAKVYLMLNKPRGLVTTTEDEKGRGTVYECFGEASLPWIAPVGRLDKASEGLLLFTNDTAWAANILEPERHVAKTYHVQVNCVPDEAMLGRLRDGIKTTEGDVLTAKHAGLLRHGEKNSWLEIVLDEGKNRQIRRLLEAYGIEVLRLVRVAIGPLKLGALAKGQWRYLTKEEVGFNRPL
jgi:23S rRNA pseudouridine2605 synthase